MLFADCSWEVLLILDDRSDDEDSEASYEMNKRQKAAVETKQRCIRVSQRMTISGLHWLDSSA